jgi:hypothetical protein
VPAGVAGRAGSIPAAASSPSGLVVHPGLVLSAAGQGESDVAQRQSRPPSFLVSRPWQAEGPGIMRNKARAGLPRQPRPHPGLLAKAAPPGG